MHLRYGADDTARKNKVGAVTIFASRECDVRGFSQPGSSAVIFSLLLSVPFDEMYQLKRKSCDKDV